VTPHVDVARRLQLVWGAKPLLVMDSPSTTQTFRAAINVAQESGLLHEGDLVVMTAGTLQGVSGSTDLIKVEMVQAVLGEGIGIGQGAASGRARIVKNSDDVNDFSQGEILVAQGTDAAYVEMIRKASGIVIEDANQNCHAATLGMRLGIPVIVGFKDATQLIRDGSIVSIDARRGTVYSGINVSLGDAVGGSKLSLT
jgi:pyruvate kinase